MTEKQGRGLLANRKRERATHLQGNLNFEKPSSKDDTKPVRISLEAYEVITDLYHERRHKSRMETVDEIIRVYLAHKDS